MSEVTDILTGRIKITRETPYLLDQTAIAATLSASRQPIKTSRLEVTVVGCTVSGALVYVTGNVVESFSFSANGTMVGTKDFSSITAAGITTVGLSGGFLKIRAVSNMGQPVLQEVVQQTSLPCRFYAQNGKIITKKPGEDLIAKYGMMVEPNIDVRSNDLVYAVSGIDGLTLGQVINTTTLFDFAGITHHIEADIMEIG